MAKNNSKKYQVVISAKEVGIPVLCSRPIPKKDADKLGKDIETYLDDKGLLTIDKFSYPNNICKMNTTEEQLSLKYYNITFRLPGAGKNKKGVYLGTNQSKAVESLRQVYDDNRAKKIKIISITPKKKIRK